MRDTSGIGAFVRGVSDAEVPLQVRHEACRFLTNIVGVTIGGSGDTTTTIAAKYVQRFGGARQARALGLGTASSVERIALIDGIAAHVLDYDDTHVPTVYHPSAPVFAALFPLAEWRGVSGASLLDAWIVGLEVGIRVAIALGREHYDAGWHVTSTAGVVAAAAASGRLLALPEEQIRNALSLAATQSFGHREQFGSMVKSFHAGQAGAVGLTASLLAGEGFVASAHGLDGRRGLFEVMSPSPRYDVLSDGLGSRWRLLDNRVKPYACGVVTHPLIDAARALADERGVRPEHVKSVALRVHPLVAELTGKRGPATGLEAKFSASHCFAAGLLFGDAGPEQFTDDVARDSRVAALRDRVSVVVDDALAHMTANATATLLSGETVTISVTTARGTEQRPLTDDELSRKFLGVVTPRTSDDRARVLFDRLMSVEKEADITSIVDLTLVAD